LVYYGDVGDENAIVDFLLDGLLSASALDEEADEEDEEEDEEAEEDAQRQGIPKIDGGRQLSVLRRRRGKILVAITGNVSV